MTIISKTHLAFSKNLFAVIAYIAVAIFGGDAYAADRVVNLVVGYKKVHFAGKEKTALCINNQIPAPTLRFNEGDRVTINVYNHLNQSTAVHWHCKAPNNYTS